MSTVTGMSLPLTSSVNSPQSLIHVLYLLSLDSFVHIPSSDRTSNVYLTSTDKNSIPELYDIPIGMVNRVLYHKRP